MWEIKYGQYWFIQSICNNERQKVSHYEYRVKNKLVDKVIRNRNILELKINVLESGLLWGITDIDVAEKLAKKKR